MCGWKAVCCLLRVQGAIQVPLVLIHVQLLGAHTGAQVRDGTSCIGAATIDGTEFAARQSGRVSHWFLLTWTTAQWCYWLATCIQTISTGFILASYTLLASQFLLKLHAVHVKWIHCLFFGMSVSGSDKLKRTGGLDTYSPTVSTFHYEQHLRQAWLTNCTSIFKTPWELALNKSWDVCKKLCTTDLTYMDLRHLLQSLQLRVEEAGRHHFEAGRCLDRVRQIIYHAMEFARSGLLESGRDSLEMRFQAAPQSRAGFALQYIQFYGDRSGQVCLFYESGAHEHWKICESEDATYARLILPEWSCWNFHGINGSSSNMISGRIEGFVHDKGCREQSFLPDCSRYGRFPQESLARRSLSRKSSVNHLPQDSRMRRAFTMMAKRAPAKGSWVSGNLPLLSHWKEGFL